MTIIYHNPRCSKSRETLKLIEEHNPEVIKYLQTPLSRDDLARIASKLDHPVAALIRPKEDEFKQSTLTLESSDEALLDFLAEHPKVLERPIVETDTAARIGRPPQAVLDIIK